MTTGQTPSADEGHAVRLKAPEELLNGSCREIINSSRQNKVKN